MLSTTAPSDPHLTSHGCRRLHQIQTSTIIFSSPKEQDDKQETTGMAKKWDLPLHITDFIYTKETATKSCYYMKNTYWPM